MGPGLLRLLRFGQHLATVLLAVVICLSGAGAAALVPDRAVEYDSAQYEYDVVPDIASIAADASVPSEWRVVGRRAVAMGALEPPVGHVYDQSQDSVAPRVTDDLVDLVSPSRRSHILDGEVRPNGTFGGGHRAGTGYPGKSEFPASWSDDQIMHYISDVATDPLSTTVRTQGRDVFVAGTRDRIDIEVLIRNGEIWTAYPTNVPRNPR